LANYRYQSFHHHYDVHFYLSNFYEHLCNVVNLNLTFFCEYFIYLHVTLFKQFSRYLLVAKNHKAKPVIQMPNQLTISNVAYDRNMHVY